jgi:hypothetical protein
MYLSPDIVFLNICSVGLSGLLASQTAKIGRLVYVYTILNSINSSSLVIT